MLSDTQIATLINQMINDKVKSHQEILSRHLHKIKDSTMDRVQANERKNEAQLYKLKEIVAEAIENYKKKSNSYWSSIKEALNKMHSKITRA